MASGLSTYVVLENDMVKVAQGRTKPQPQLLAFVSAKPKGQDDESLANCLRELLQALPQPAQELEFLLPRHSAIIRVVELPSSEEGEIRELAGFQAVKLTPYSLDEIVWDLQVLDKKGGSSRVSLVIAQKNLVTRALRIAQKVDRQILAMRLASQAFEASFLATKPSSSIQAEPIAFISIDATRSHVLILGGGAHRYTRNFPAGWQQIFQGQAGRQKLVSEMELSVRAYKKENPSTASLRMAYFESSQDEKEDIAPLVKAAGFSQAIALDPLSFIAKDPSYRASSDAMVGVSCAEVLGGILNPSILTLNFLPTEYKQQRKSSARRRHLGQTLVLVGLFAALCLVYVAERTTTHRQYLEKLQNKLISIQTKAKLIEDRSDKLDITHAIARNQGEVVQVLRELYNLFPGSISLSSLSYQREHTVVIKGTAKDLSDVFQLIPILEKSDYFENVTSDYASKRKAYGQEFADFQIQCVLSKQHPKTEDKNA